MKLAPKIIGLAAVMLLLPSCTLPAPDLSAENEPDIIFESRGVPNPAQTTWSTPEPTSTVRPTEAVPKSVDTQPEPSVSLPADCEGIDPVLVFRFERSQMKCQDLLTLRERLVDEVGEQYADAALMQHHERYCTQYGGNQTAEPLPYEVPTKPELDKVPVNPVMPLDGVNENRADTAEMDLGKYVACREPSAKTK